MFSDYHYFSKIWSKSIYAIVRIKVSRKNLVGCYNLCMMWLRIKTMCLIRLYICTIIVTSLSDTWYSIGLLFQFPIILLSWLWLEFELWNILPQTYLIYPTKDKQYYLWVLAWNIFSANKSWLHFVYSTFIIEVHIRF